MKLDQHVLMYKTHHEFVIKEYETNVVLAHYITAWAVLTVVLIRQNSTQVDSIIYCKW